MNLPLRVAHAGAALDRARAVVILLHGRGATAESMFGLADVFEQPDIAYCAPQASQGTWYPYSFLAPIERNEPHLSQSLTAIGELVAGLNAQGFAASRLALVGFSQGGCLALEFAARNARRYGAIAGLSAGLIGPENAPRNYAGSLDGTPVLVGCSDDDPHIPLDRVRESSRVLSALGGTVTERIYRGRDHMINDDEVMRMRRMLAELVS